MNIIKRGNGCGVIISVEVKSQSKSCYTFVFSVCVITKQSNSVNANMGKQEIEDAQCPNFHCFDNVNLGVLSFFHAVALQKAK